MVRKLIAALLCASGMAVAMTSAEAAVGEKTYDQAATELLAFVQGQLKK